MDVLVSHRRHHSSLVKCSQIHIVWMHHVKVFYVFICSIHDFNAAAFVFFHIFLKRFLCGCSCVRIWKKKIRQIRIEGNEKGETEKKWFKRAKLWGSRSLNWRESKKKNELYVILTIDAAMNKTEKKNREQIQKSKEISAVNRCRQRWQRQRERERRNMCVLLWFHCFAQKLTWNQLKFTAGRMKNSAFWIASIVFFVVFPSRFGFQFASFHLSWSLYFFSSRSLSCGTMKNTHASYSNSHTSSKHLCWCWCFDVAMFTSLDLLCVWCFAFVIVFLARSLFWSLSFLLLVGFCGFCCSNAGAAGVLFSLHTQRHRHSLSISPGLL